ncbi:RNase H domain-containing protein [Trichonephila clavipes]|nr:RNase H domain-containing protein [Trichonephila clavipes]
MVRRRSELIAISGALNSYKDSIWTLTVSRSSIQYLKNLPKITDSTGLDILSKLARLGQRKQVCLQWIPSHADVPGNEAAIVRVQYFVRGGIVWPPLPCKFKASLLHLPVDGVRFLGRQKGVALQLQDARVGVGSTKDADRCSELRRYTADELAGRGCDLSNPSSTNLNHSEIPSLQRTKMNLTWRNPDHHWYAAKSPGLSLQCRSPKAHQMALARFRSGHLRSI